MKCLSTNTDCIFNKINEIEPFLTYNNIDIAAFTETMPKNCSNIDLRNVQLNIKGYNCLSNHNGRGVCLYVNNDFEILERLDNVESLFTPSIFCKIKCKNDVVVVGVVYRSPNSSSEENDKLNNQIDFIAKMLQASGERLIMVGDFNYPDRLGPRSL